ncbi:MAG: RBBP9/YdeN family alpha/beta hydrolase [Burkholderiales bacterium]
METIVPGLGDSNRNHWQSWLQVRLRNSLRVVQLDWDKPNLGVWRRTVRQTLHHVRGRVFIVAHSFGCLASVCVVADRPRRIAGMMLVARADPRKFDVAHLLPHTPLDCPSVVVASSDDPWLPLPQAAYWPQRWGSRLCNLGSAGHINADSGFGPWPKGADILRTLQRSTCPLSGPLKLRVQVEPRSR